MASAINPDSAALQTFVGDTLRIFRTLSPRTAKPCGFFFALAAILGVYRNTLSPLIEKTETSCRSCSAEIGLKSPPLSKHCAAVSRTPPGEESLDEFSFVAPATAACRGWRRALFIGAGAGHFARFPRTSFCGRGGRNIRFGTDCACACHAALAKSRS